jgi:hypothetical protein
MLTLVGRGLLAAIGMIVLIPGLIWLVMGIGVAAMFSLGGVHGFIIGLAFVLPAPFITGLGGALVYGALKLRRPFEMPRDFVRRTLVLVTSLVVIEVGLGLTLASVLWLENVTYADIFFSRIGLEYREVLASRRWRPTFGSHFDCTYAVVSLPDDANPDPPATGVEWSTTPPAIPRTREAWQDPLAVCDSLPSEAATQLRAAVEGVGSYYWPNGTGTLLYVYSKPHGLAASIGYGD